MNQKRTSITVMGFFFFFFFFSPFFFVLLFISRLFNSHRPPLISSVFLRLTSLTTVHSMGEDNAMRRQNSPGTHSSASKHPPLCHTPVSKTLPPPWLDFSFRVATHFETEATTVDVPDMGATELWTVSRGTWSGSLGIGTVVAGGYAQGHERTRSRLQRRETCRVDTMLKFRTEDEPPALDARQRLHGPHRSTRWF
ncbi:hypothetical protein SODALDRAFT_109843 [Sodiomyces alkalinus F11]|uniref:Uncharacterized protein n=1 Tax=Sodiomyces alkalinus (strain CBS 110278 / VKM F-3762 / F11) TaxID=1314773 RepID=A0A3N2Q2P2_SODAK|nr:hypothetical protein SODALDRAFT_109843 [Sodiomyces alkalinus F11]ROT41020.1 hypothetical protein SODALDRAFT_109843 [Sodiomyces alkalinus F11]